MPRPLLSHIDLRVRDRSRSAEFYGRVLGALGCTRRDSDGWTSYYASSGPAEFEWFGFTDDAAPEPNANRIAFVATTNEEVDRVAAVLHELGAGVIEGPNYDEGPGYYAVFFEDPDGHRLEVCCRVE